MRPFLCLRHRTKILWRRHFFGRAVVRPLWGEGSPRLPARCWTHRLTARSVIQREEGKTIQKNVNPERGIELLEICFDTFCKNGLEGTSMKMLSEACGVTNAALVYYFGTKDAIIVEATAHCMAKVEEDFMAQAPRDFADIERFLREMPYLTAKLHGPKYRFMYQVYASPRYREEGKAFFQGVNVRYRKYAERLSPQLGLPVEVVQGMTYLFVRACVHYALFEDEAYLNLQRNAIRLSLRMFVTERDPKEEKP